MGSVWNETIKTQPRSALAEDRNTDVLIVGGGMAGILCAYRLKEAGVPCIVAEAKTVGSGVTGNTTAKITAQHGLIYADLIKRFGAEQASLYYNANTRAINEFRSLADKYPCDFKETTAYVYTMSDKRKTEREAASYQALGIPGGYVETLPLPFKTAGAVMMERQARFHPLKLLTALADALKIYENTFIRKIDGGTAYTDNGKITAKHIILATHFPLINIPGLYFIKLYQHRSYVIAFENAPLPDGIFVDERKDGMSFRSYKDLLFIGGGDHKTGKQGGGYAELRNFAKAVYPQAVERFHWATQDCMTLDGIPYIGRHRSGSKNLYVATGFNKWGMTGSMVAAELLTDLITTGKSTLEHLYSPQRSMMTGQFFINLGAAAAGLLNPGGPRCSHMGCKLHKNHAEGTWDCSCHGSRYSIGGSIIDNPAKRDIHP